MKYLAEVYLEERRMPINEFYCTHYTIDAPSITHARDVVLNLTTPRTVLAINLYQVEEGEE